MNTLREHTEHTKLLGDLADDLIFSQNYEINFISLLHYPAGISSKESDWAVPLSDCLLSDQSTCLFILLIMYSILYRL